MGLSGDLDLSAGLDSDGVATGQGQMVGVRVQCGRRVRMECAGQQIGIQWPGRVVGVVNGPFQLGADQPGWAGLETDPGHILLGLVEAQCPVQVEVGPAGGVDGPRAPPPLSYVWRELPSPPPCCNSCSITAG